MNEFKVKNGLIVDAGGAQVTGSLNAPSITGSLFGTSSNSLTSSYSLTASITTLGIVTASANNTTITFTKGDSSTFSVTVSQSGSVATASYALTSVSSSYSQFAATASYFSGSVTSISSSYAVTSSYAVDGPGVNYTLSYTQPTSINTIWVDTSSSFNNAYPIRYYVNGAWTTVTPECDWWDPVASTISKGRPIVVLFSGQSNAAAAVTTSNGYTGDVSVDKYVTYWDETSGSSQWRVYDWANNKYPGYSEGTPVAGTTEVHTFSKLFAKEFNRTVRIIGTRHPGQTLASSSGWEVSSVVGTGSAWTTLINRVSASGIGYADVFHWVHGEAELGSPSAFTTYQDCWFDFIGRLRQQSWFDYKTKILFYSNGIDVATTNISPVYSEGTARGLDANLDPYLAWVRGIDSKESPSDAFHFTAGDRERMGTAAYSRFKSMPGVNRTKTSGTSVWNKFSGSLLVSQTSSYVNVDSLIIKHQVYTANTTGALFTYAFGAGGADTYTTRAVGVGQGTFGRVNYEIWNNGVGANATTTDKTVGFQSEGTVFAKPVILLSGSSLTISNTANNSGDALLYFNNAGAVTPSNTISRTGIISRPQGSFGYGNLHFVIGGTGNNSNIASDTKFWIGMSAAGVTDTRFGFNLGSTTTSAFIHGVQSGVSGANAAPVLLLSGGAHVTANAGVEVNDIVFNLARPVQWSAGTLSTQRSGRYLSPIWNFVSASVINSGSTFSISGPPIAGTNTSISHSSALIIERGTVGTGSLDSYGATIYAPSGAINNYAAQFIGTTKISGNLIVTGSVSATNLTGSIFGTSSYAVTASNVITSSYSLTAMSSSVSLSALSASYVTGSVHNSANPALSASYALTASYVLNSTTTQTFPYTGSAIISGSLTVTGSVNITGSTIQTGNTSLIGNTNIFGTSNLSGSIVISGSVSASANMSLAGWMRLDPTADPGGANVTASYVFTSASNTPTGYDLYYRQDGNLVKFKWLEGMLGSGLLYGGVLSYSASVVFVSSGSGIIINENASTSSEIGPIINYVKWGALSQSIAANITGSQATYVYINSNGTLGTQADTFFTPTQYATTIPLGMVNHSGRDVITSVANNTYTVYNTTNQAFDFIQSFGPLKISGLTVGGQAGTLRLNISSGESYILGGFYQQDPTNVSHKTTAAFLTASIARVWRSGSTGTSFITDNNSGSFYTVIDPTQYDNNGVLTVTSGGSYTIQRVFFNPFTGRTHVYYGQNQYNTAGEALANLSSDTFTEAQYTAHQYVFVAYLIVKSNTTDLTSTADNKIVQAGLFRNTVGSSGGTSLTPALNDISDVTLTTPSTGQALVYNGTLWVNGTPSLASTASYVLQAVSASYATTSSYSLTATSSSFSSTAITSSYVTGSVHNSTNPALSASFATTSSYASNGGVTSFNTRTGAVTLTSADISVLGAGIISSSAFTASWSTNSVTASYILQAVSSSYATTSSYSLTAQTLLGSVVSAQTASYLNPLNQGNIFITGSVYVSGSSSSLLIGGNVTASTEASLIIGIPPNGVGGGEGGQIILQAAGGTYTTASMIDNYQNKFRILRGTNTASDAYKMQIDMHTGQVQIPNYQSSTSFVGTATANLAVDSAGNIITVSTSGGTVFPYSGVATITGSLVVTGSSSFTGSISIIPTSNSSTAAITVSGSGTKGGTTYVDFLSVTNGAATTTPTKWFRLDNVGTLQIVNSTYGATIFGLTDSGQLSVTGITSSLFGTSSWSSNSVTASYASNGGVTSFNTRTGTVTLISADISGLGAGIISSSAFTASWASNAVTASFVTTAATASYILQAISASYASNGGVTTFNTRTGAVTLTATDISGLGAGIISSSAFTSSWSNNSVSASYVSGSVHTSANPALSASYSVTSSYSANGGVTSFNTRTGAITLTSGDISGLGAGIISSSAFTASWATNAVTASYVTGSIHTSTNPALSASYALTSSYSSNGGVTSFNTRTGGVTLSATDISSLGAGIISSSAFTASWANNAVTASYILQAVSASYSSNGGVTSFNTRTGAITLSTTDISVLGAGIISSSAFTASWATNAVTASYVLQSVSASYATTASYILGGTSSVTVQDEGVSQGAAGTINFVGAGVTATVSTGVATITIPGGAGNAFPYTGSAAITGSLSVTGSVNASSGFTGSLLGTASYAYTQIRQKSGFVAAASFGGSPRTASVTFTTSFADTNYSINVTGEDNRVWMVQSKTASGFVINSNSSVAVTGNTYWIVMAYGETI